MPTFVALLRGVNVGKANRVPMARFRELLARLGYTGPRTLLNSGNAVFRAPRGAPAAHAAAITEALAVDLGVEVPAIVVTAEELAAIIAQCPVTVSADQHSRLLVAFVQEPGSLASLAGISSLVKPPERFEIGERAAYLHVPAGILQSKAGEALLGKAGRAATTRNWATVLKLRALAGALLLFALCAPAAAQSVRDPALRAELERMGREDQAAREGFGPAAARNDTAYMRRLMQGDSARTERLRAIVRERGWPGRSMVGEEAASAAWLVLQHSASTAFQREMLPALWRQAEAGEVAKGEVALLEDRVLVREGQPQRFGNSFSVVDGTLVPDPIADTTGLDARRAALGLPPMTEYVRVLREVYGMPVTWPPAR